MSRGSIACHILCEDQQQEYFIRHFLIGRMSNQCKKRQIRRHPLPWGRGSGEQSVRKHFQKALEIHRRSGASSIFIAMIDADTYSVQERKKSILGTIKSKDSDRFIILVPKRNIETWIYYLRHDKAEENENYKNKLGLKREKDCRQEIDKLVDGCVNKNLGSVPPSLQDACDEYNLLIEKM